MEGRNGRNLMFTVDEDGRIRPAIAFASALTVDDSGSLSFDLLDEAAHQVWRAGAA